MPFSPKFASMGGTGTGAGAPGSSVPLKNAIAYLDPAAPGTGAAVGNGVPFNDFMTAYIAARGHGGNVTLCVAPGYYTAYNLDCYPHVTIVGSGSTSTRIDITNYGTSAHEICGRDFTLNLTIYGNNGADGSPPYLESPEARGGDPGQSVSGSITGMGGTIALRSLMVMSGNGGTASAPYDNGESQMPGAPGGSAGALSFSLTNVERFGDHWTLYTGTPGAGSSGIYAGESGSTGGEGTSTLHFTNVRNGTSPLTENTLTVGSTAACYALDCQLATLSGGMWTANGCHYTNNFSSTLGDYGGAPNYIYASGI